MSRKREYYNRRTWQITIRHYSEWWGLVMMRIAWGCRPVCNPRERSCEWTGQHLAEVFAITFNAAASSGWWSYSFLTSVGYLNPVWLLPRTSTIDVSVEFLWWRNVWSDIEESCMLIIRSVNWKRNFRCLQLQLTAAAERRFKDAFDTECLATSGIFSKAIFSHRKFHSIRRADRTNGGILPPAQLSFPAQFFSAGPKVQTRVFLLRLWTPNSCFTNLKMIFE
jgi:hypothetical protein